MDTDRFDRITRLLADRRDRRGALKAATAAGAALFGLRSAAGAEDLTVEGNKGQGRPCSRNKQCGSGLRCEIDTFTGNGTCRYKNGICGKKNDYCKDNRDCCGGLRCGGGSGNNKKCQRL